MFLLNVKSQRPKKRKRIECFVALQLLYRRKEIMHSPNSYTLHMVQMVNTGHGMCLTRIRWPKHTSKNRKYKTIEMKQTQLCSGCWACSLFFFIRNTKPNASRILAEKSGHMRVMGKWDGNTTDAICVWSYTLYSEIVKKRQHKINFKTILHFLFSIAILCTLCYSTIRPNCAKSNQ